MTSRQTKAGWTLAIDSDKPPAAPFVTTRDIARLAGAGNASLPAPPRSEMHRWQGKAHAALCDATLYADIDAIYRRILQNSHRPGELAAFGDYLTAVLLGPNLDSLEASQGPIDMRLSLDDAELQRLPWEMMYGPHDTDAAAANLPLSARPNRRIAINREVAIPQRAALPEFRFPLRVLFVAGTKIDAVLRPGAEFLGLLRHLKIPADPLFKGAFTNTSVNLRFLPDGDVDELKRMCDEFEPSVLHFICHGESNPAGGPSQIVLRQRTTAGTLARYPMTAADLVNHLVANNGWLPQIVVLNACYTGSVPGSAGAIEDAHLPFAESLVSRGVAIAVGMAGEVAEPACQMFTLRFYQALLTSASVTEAASQARRAVLTAWPSHQQSVEWMRPTLFIGAGVDPAVKFAAGPNFDLFTPALRFRKIGLNPEMMCDRYEILVAYERLLRLTDRPDSDRLLVAFEINDSTRGLGRTRVLEEFAIRAVLDGFLPCVLRASGDMPKSFLEFALALSDAMAETLENFGCKEVLLTQSRRLAIETLGDVPEQDAYPLGLQVGRLRTRLGREAGSGVNARTVLTAIRADCGRMISEVAKISGRQHRVMILIDELHRCAGAHNEILDQIGFAGFGTAEDPIPVVVNYLDSSLEGREIQGKVKHLPIERRPEIKRFDTDVERVMVCRQFMLSRWGLAPNQSRDQEDNVKQFLLDMHDKTKGVPLAFLDPKVEGFVQGAYKYGKVLVDADYEEVLRSYGA